jgi:hypothetical protein
MNSIADRNPGQKSGPKSFYRKAQSHDMPSMPAADVHLIDVSGNQEILENDFVNRRYSSMSAVPLPDDDVVPTVNLPDTPCFLE